MPRVYTVKSARQSKRTRRCITCGHEVQPGESYRYAEPRYGGMLIWCHQHHARRSQLTGSKLSSLYRAIEDYEDSIGNASTPTEVASLLENVASTAREVSEEYEESACNIEEHFTDSPKVDELREEYVEPLESFADELERIASEIEDLEVECECDEDFANNSEDGEHQIGCPLHADEDDPTEQARELANDALGESPF